MHIGDQGLGNLSQPSQNQLCVNQTSALIASINPFECDDGPLLGKFVELRTRWPPARPKLQKYALFIAEISVFFEEGDVILEAMCGMG